MNDMLSRGEARLIRVSEAATLLSISRSKVYELIAKGELPVVRIDGILRVDRVALERWLDDLRSMQSVAIGGS